jgi:N-acetyl-anhydromuramyl-L-alanine amidase AmpD
VLHHTVGGSALSSIRWWRDDPRVVGTAYIIERDGTVYETFPPQCWAWHIGIKDARIEQRSIGIELASEGGLIEQDGKLWAFAGPSQGGKLLGNADTLLGAGRVLKLTAPYRGFTWFDSYDEPQVTAAIALVDDLCTRFSVPRVLPVAVSQPSGDFRPYFAFEGVVHHAMMRKDKSDLHPGFAYSRLGAALGDPQWA